ncbi:MAG: isopentenyl-diphosphate Delta-isomerase [Actinomycetota bacterium]
MSELIVLVDEEGRPIGEAEKNTSHNAQTPLHLGFSCYLFDRAGRLLVTRRAITKKVWPGVWSNTVCGHPMPGEPPEEAIARRLDYELGVRASSLEVVLPCYRYAAPAFNGIVENEFCPVYLGRCEGSPDPNPPEVASFEWMTWTDFSDAAGSDRQGRYSWWCKDQLKQLAKHPAIADYTAARP